MSITLATNDSETQILEYIFSSNSSHKFNSYCFSAWTGVSLHVVPELSFVDLFVFWFRQFCMSPLLEKRSLSEKISSFRYLKSFASLPDDVNHTELGLTCSDQSDHNQFVDYTKNFKLLPNI